MAAAPIAPIGQDCWKDVRAVHAGVAHAPRRLDLLGALGAGQAAAGQGRVLPGTSPGDPVSLLEPRKQVL